LIKSAIMYLWFVISNLFEDGNLRIAITLTDMILAKMTIVHIDFIQHYLEFRKMENYITRRNDINNSILQKILEI